MGGDSLDLLAGNRPAARRRQRAALIRLKLRSSAQTEGVGRMRARNPNCPFSPWEKAGMRASGGRTPTGFDFTHDEVRLPQALTRIGSKSQSPHPCLLPEGEGVIPKASSAILALSLVFCLSPTRSGWACDDREKRDQGRALFERSEFARTPVFLGQRRLTWSEAQGTQTAGRLSFAYFSLATQRKVSRRRATPAPERRKPLRPIQEQAHADS